jgi:hypothetical protein
VALSLTGLDNLSGAFFRIDCRAADAGCTASRMLASWHAHVHVAAFVVAGLATAVAPFVLASRMKHLDGWRDLVRAARIFGVLTIVALVVSGVTTGTPVQGWTQRAAAVLVAFGVAALAARAFRLTSRSLGALLQAAGR